jgi:multidrug efflux pump subunit AcrA (membrane-fusion protein)
MDCEAPMNASTVRESSEIAEAAGWLRRLRGKGGAGPPKGSPKGSGGAAESLVPRVAGYALLAFVLWLVVTTLIQPLVSRQATRTVLQAPVLLVTSPISGVVTRMTVRAGDQVNDGTLVATVQNPTINRDILTTLTTQRLALQSQVAQLANQLNASSEELQFVDQQASSTAPPRWRRRATPGRWRSASARWRSAAWPSRNSRCATPPPCSTRAPSARRPWTRRRRS